MLTVLTVICLPVLVIAGISFSHDRATVMAFDSAPVCRGADSGSNPASTSGSDSGSNSCRRDTVYTVVSANGTGGKNAQFQLGLQSATGSVISVQLVSDTGVWPARDGEQVTVTSWQGTPLLISDGRNTSTIVNGLLKSGAFPYFWLWTVGSVYLYLSLFAIVRRGAEVLLAVPVLSFCVGIALYGRLVGGVWWRDPLLIAGGIALVYSLSMVGLNRRSGRRMRTGSSPADVRQG